VGQAQRQGHLEKQERKEVAGPHIPVSSKLEMRLMLSIAATHPNCASVRLADRPR
jgi:hypothetical protein